MKSQTARKGFLTRKKLKKYQIVRKSLPPIRQPNPSLLPPNPNNQTLLHHKMRPLERQVLSLYKSNHRTKKLLPKLSTATTASAATHKIINPPTTTYQLQTRRRQTNSETLYLWIKSTDNPVSNRLYPNHQPKQLKEDLKSPRNHTKNNKFRAI